MGDQEIKVTAYAGYRGEESPMAFVFRGEKINVVEVLDRRVEQDVEEKTTRRWFRLKGDDRKIYHIYYHETAMTWFLHSVSPVSF
ncbi:MAG: hypothetical protein COT35_04315 [Nitrospirae bacterium CG08_land_8_20_14_0_20_52_24]|nr:MAG: hypothetical protein AUK29_05515 [Nitrospirae bacterium CG2_30_53_67]PIS37776.1 MAG: hypothetical protein COT35_04315 [Nitrospirae bacterium CG08_land_8_20_14_0_20_52_24]PIW84352.1 MAG: hypothetical protein COZ95_10225 [Nitrospirae bacterium CG_4_8_14_3_um_filter_50_41]PIX85145.1 MAG: hypothetical protein COZ32_10020 [Nitrospirae bacterium CG_4_10_14_3_um_filter_53_41]